MNKQKQTWKEEGLMKGRERERKKERERERERGRE
jgi:hypothetical protein